MQRQRLVRIIAAVIAMSLCAIVLAERFVPHHEQVQGTIGLPASPAGASTPLAPQTAEAPSDHWAIVFVLLPGSILLVLPQKRRAVAPATAKSAG